MRKTVAGLSVAAVATLLISAATADAAVSRRVSVMGKAEIDTHDPVSVFDFSVHAQGDGRTGRGVVWMSHHNDEEIGWLVARVDCVRAEGRVGIVTAVVTDTDRFAEVMPGDSISFTVRDNGTKDGISFAAGEQVQRCDRSPMPEHEITRGDFQVSSVHR